jgi:hypothetical protein
MSYYRIIIIDETHSNIGHQWKDPFHPGDPGRQVPTRSQRAGPNDGPLRSQRRSSLQLMGLRSNSILRQVAGSLAMFYGCLLSIWAYQRC